MRRRPPFEATRQTNPSSARDRLRLAVPAVATLLDRLAARGESLRVHVARLLALLDDYSSPELAAAVERALEARLRQRVERRLTDARLGRLKVMADWDWPKAIHRPTIERVLTLEFLTQPHTVEASIRSYAL